MNKGDLYKITCKDGAIEYDLGIYVSKYKNIVLDGELLQSVGHWKLFLVNGTIRAYHNLDFKFEVVYEER